MAGLMRLNEGLLAAAGALALAAPAAAQFYPPEGQSLSRMGAIEIARTGPYEQTEGSGPSVGPFSPTGALAASETARRTAKASPQIRLEPPEYLDDLRDRLDQAATFDKTVGLAAAIIENGEVAMIYTAGETAAGSGEEVTAQTRFRAASLTKSFTGVLLAILESEGLIDLNAKVPTSILDLKGSAQPTWIELMSQRSGLPPNAYDNLIEGGVSAQEARARLSTVDLVCQPGECYTYQNVAFSAAEFLIEQATGLSYEEAVRRYIFGPYGLTTAGVGEDDLVSGPSWARPHRGWVRSRDQAGDPSSYYDRVPSAAAITVSLNDMIAWAQANLAWMDGLPEDVRERVFTPYAESRRETRGLGPLRARVDETYYGLGWRVYEWGDRTLIAHSGYLSGYGAQVVMEPETGFAFVALWNADGRAPWRLWPTVMDLRTGDGPGDWLDQID
ncbi:MAG: serine hydrolase domain-containing protein [Oceanicaulis sp.]